MSNGWKNDHEKICTEGGCKLPVIFLVAIRRWKKEDHFFPTSMGFCIIWPSVYFFLYFLHATNKTTAKSDRFPESFLRTGTRFPLALRSIPSPGDPSLQLKGLMFPELFPDCSMNFIFTPVGASFSGRVLASYPKSHSIESDNFVTFTD